MTTKRARTNQTNDIDYDNNINTNSTSSPSPSSSSSSSMTSMMFRSNSFGGVMLNEATFLERMDAIHHASLPRMLLPSRMANTPIHEIRARISDELLRALVDATMQRAVLNLLSDEHIAQLQSCARPLAIPLPQAFTVSLTATSPKASSLISRATIDSLPSDLLLNVFSYLPSVRILGDCYRICRRWMRTIYRSNAPPTTWFQYERDMITSVKQLCPAWLPTMTRLRFAEIDEDDVTLRDIHDMLSSLTPFARLTSISIDAKTPLTHNSSPCHMLLEQFTSLTRLAWMSMDAFDLRSLSKFQLLREIRITETPLVGAPYPVNGILIPSKVKSLELARRDDEVEIPDELVDMWDQLQRHQIDLSDVTLEYLRLDGDWVVHGIHAHSASSLKEFIMVHPNENDILTLNHSVLLSSLRCVPSLHWQGPIPTPVAPLLIHAASSFTELAILDVTVTCPPLTSNTFKWL
jgi:hypothetical protein